MLRNKRTKREFTVIDQEEPSRRFPLGRFRLSDGHWRSGEMIRDDFEEVEDEHDSGVDTSGYPGEARGLDGGDEGGLHLGGPDSGAEGEDDEGEVGPEGDSGDTRGGDEDSVLEDA